MDSLQLTNWCKGEGIDPEHALLVNHVPDNAEAEVIVESLEAIKALGLVQVKGRMYNPTLQRLSVLCQCSGKVNLKALPLEVIPMKEGEPVIGAEPWTLSGQTDEEAPAAEGPDARYPGQRVASLISEEDEQELTGACAQANSATASIIHAVGELLEKTLEKTLKPHNESNAFRRLRAYSGLIPTPAGEETLDAWLEQARLMVDECECSDKKKRKSGGEKDGEKGGGGDSSFKSREFISSEESSSASDSGKKDKKSKKSKRKDDNDDEDEEVATTPPSSEEESGSD